MYAARSDYDLGLQAGLLHDAYNLVVSLTNVETTRSEI